MKNFLSYKKIFLVLFVCICLFLGFRFYTNSNIKTEERTTEQAKVVEKVTYIHTDNTFKFNYPGDLKFSNLAEDTVGASNETIIFSSLEPKKGFEIFISPYFGNAPLGIDMIMKGNPDLDVSNSQAVDLPPGKIISFLAKPVGSDFTTREIWFVSGGNLYQVSAFIEFEQELNEIMKSWEWNSV